MRFGCTVRLDFFSENRGKSAEELYNAFGGTDALFTFLGDNVDSVELHTVSEHTDLGLLEKAVSVCREHGLSCTYHGTLIHYTAPENFFSPFEYLLDKGLASMCNITVHPQDNYERIEPILRELCDYADKKDLSIRICLENQRVKKAEMTCGTCADVVDIVSRIHSDRLKICFDFGHRKSNAEKFGEEADIVPEEFYSRAGHTHIHSYDEGTTHFPIHVGKVQLHTNLLALFRNGYGGVLNLELCPDRFCGYYDVKESYVNSISVLKTAAAQAQAMLAAMEKFEQYCDYAEPVFAALETEKYGFGAIAPAAYVFRFGDVKLAVDPSFIGFSNQEEKYACLFRKLADFDAVIITHGHGDHYDPGFLAELGKNVKIYLPDFLQCENTTPYSAEDTIRVGELTISAFPSCHDEIGMEPIQEYGLKLTYHGKTILMPTDVRDYCTDHFKGIQGDMLIAHLWLGRRNGLNLYNNKFIPEFCRFVNGFGASRVFIGHMDDTRRKMDSIWTDVHFNAMRDEMPGSETIKFGDYKSLAFMGFDEA
ncbi:MAG: TIM barrel protein [Clostridia bacterium]|nr:TIM barrel protein [Clostridia bacterium]